MITAHNNAYKSCRQSLIINLDCRHALYANVGSNWPKQNYATIDFNIDIGISKFRTWTSLRRTGVHVC